MTIRSAVEILEEYDRALSSATKKNIWKKVDRALDDEEPVLGLVALGVLLGKEKDQSLVEPTVFEKVRRLLGKRESAPDDRTPPIRFLGHDGLREADTHGNFRTFDLLYRTMMDETEPESLRHQAGRSLILWGSAWLTKQAKGSAKLADFFREAPDTIKKSPLAAAAAKRWIGDFRSAKDEKRRLQAAVLLAANEEGLSYLPDLKGFLNSKIPENLAGGDDQLLRWTALARLRIDELLKKFSATP